MCKPGYRYTHRARTGCLHSVRSSRSFFLFGGHHGWRSSRVLFIRRHFAIIIGILHAGFTGLLAKFEAFVLGCRVWKSFWRSFLRKTTNVRGVCFVSCMRSCTVGAVQVVIGSCSVLS